MDSLYAQLSSELNNSDNLLTVSEDVYAVFASLSAQLTES
jgi:hypothetical protein